MRKVAMLLLIILLITFLSPAGYSMTVDEAVQLGLEHNPDLMVFRSEEEIAKGQLEKAGLLLRANPIIEGNISKKDRPPEEEGDKYTNYGFRLAQEFELAGQRGIRIDIAEKEILRISSEIKNKERVLIADIQNSFATVLAAQKKRDLAKENMTFQEELSGFVLIKLKAGEVSQLEVNIAEVELYKARKDLLSIDRESKAALFALQDVMGIAPDINMRVEGYLPTKAPGIPDREMLRSITYMQRPDLRAASFDVEKTQSAVTLVQREAFQNPTASGFYNKDEQKNEIGIGLSFPLPLFDRKQAEKREALARAEQAKIKAGGIKKTIEREFEQAYSNLTAAAEELYIFREGILSKASENLKLINFSFKEGKIGFFEVRLAKKEMLEMRAAYIESQLKTQMAINALERITGRSLR